MKIRIQTSRLLIRNLLEEDRLIYNHIYRDPVLMKFIGGPIPQKIITKFFGVTLNDWNPSSNFTLTLAITKILTGKTIGLCGLKMSSISPMTAELGIIITQDNWSKGYASEVFEMLVDFCFVELNLSVLEGSPNRNNKQSIKLISKFGYLFEKHFDFKLSYLNKKIPSSRYLLTKDNYIKQQRENLTQGFYCSNRLLT